MGTSIGDEKGATIGIHYPFPLLEPDTNRAPKKHISKHKDRDIPYTPPYNEAQKEGISP